MHLTVHSDYALRVLLYLRVRPDRRVTIVEIAGAYGISKNHLMKVVNRLAQLGFIHATRGRGGGLELAREPASINLGEVVRRTEPHFDLVECFEPKTNTCPIVPVCELKGVLGEAAGAFMTVLDRYTLADIGTKPDALAEHFLV